MNFSGRVRVPISKSLTLLATMWSPPGERELNYENLEYFISNEILNVN
jgi:hypothetical protein